MRALVTVAMAVIGSLLVSATVATLLADYFRGDVGYILVFFAIPLAAVIAAVTNMIARTRPEPKRAHARTCLGLSILVAACFVLLLLLHLLAGLESWLFWREMELASTICISMLAVVLVQWLVFRAVAGAARQTPKHAGPSPEAPA